MWSLLVYLGWLSHLLLSEEVLPNGKTWWKEKFINETYFLYLVEISQGRLKQEYPNGGQIVFSVFESNHFRGEHTYVPMIPNIGFWKLWMSWIIIGTKEIQLCVPQCITIVDSGMSDIHDPRIRNLSVSEYI